MQPRKRKIAVKKSQTLNSLLNTWLVGIVNSPHSSTDLTIEQWTKNNSSSPTQSFASWHQIDKAKRAH